MARWNRRAVCDDHQGDDDPCGRPVAVPVRSRKPCPRGASREAVRHPGVGFQRADPRARTEGNPMTFPTGAETVTVGGGPIPSADGRRDGRSVALPSRTVFLTAVTPVVDLDLLADTEIVNGTPVSIAAVTSVAGRTGTITGAALMFDVDSLLLGFRSPVTPPPEDRIGWDSFDRANTTTTLGTSSCGQ